MRLTFSPALLLLILHLSAGAQTAAVYDMPQLSGEVSIDGVVDEAIWDQALSLELEYETRPGENTPAQVHTRAYLFEDGTHLYIAFRAQDPDPEQIRAYLRDRDRTFNDDFVGINLDTFGAGQRAYEFYVNPLGVQTDLIYDELATNNKEDSSWDGIWESAGRLTDTGYQVEMRIPFSTLRFPAGQQTRVWRFDLLRLMPRSNQFRLSINPIERGSNCYLCQLPGLRGFADARSGSAVELTPTFTARYEESREEVTDPDLISDTDLEPGLDLSWSITPETVLNATLNPDFSQVEADVARLSVNETFALFFPEKRPFFLERAEYFDTPTNLVYTRNIIDPNIGGKITGRTGTNTYGVFLADDTQTNFVVPGPLGSDIASIDDDSINAAFRYRRDLSGQSGVGGLFTARTGTDYHNYVAGIDGRYQPNESDTFDFQLVYSDSEYPQEVREEFDLPEGKLSGHSGRISYQHAQRNFVLDLALQDVSPDFRGDLGFINRVDFRAASGDFRYRWYGEPDDWWTEIQVVAEGDRIEDQSGRLLNEEFELRTNLQGPLQSFLQVGIEDGRVRDEDQVFSVTQYETFLRARPVSGVSAVLFAQTGDKVDFSNNRLGEGARVRPELFWNINRHLLLEMRHTYDRLDVPEGRLFTANLTDLRLSYQFDLRSRLRVVFQYFDIERDASLYIDEVDNRTRDFAVQLLYSYKINPRTLFFAGYSEGQQETDEVQDLTTLNRTLFMKLSYAFNL